MVIAWSLYRIVFKSPLISMLEWNGHVYKLTAKYDRWSSTTFLISAFQINSILSAEFSRKVFPFLGHKPTRNSHFSFSLNENCRDVSLALIQEHSVWKTNPKTRPIGRKPSCPGNSNSVPWCSILPCSSLEVVYERQKMLKIWKKYTCACSPFRF